MKIKKEIEQIAGELVDEFSEEDLIKLVLLIDGYKSSCGFSIDLTASLKQSYIDEFGKQEFNQLTKKAKIYKLYE